MVVGRQKNLSNQSKISKVAQSAQTQNCRELVAPTEFPSTRGTFLLIPDITYLLALLICMRSTFLCSHLCELILAMNELFSANESLLHKLYCRQLNVYGFNTVLILKCQVVFEMSWMQLSIKTFWYFSNYYFFYTYQNFLLF